MVTGVGKARRPLRQACPARAARRSPLGHVALLVWLLLLAPLAVTAGAIEVTRVETHLHDGTWHLDADLRTTLEPRAVEALGHGVPLTLTLTVRLEPLPRWYWPWPEAIMSVEEVFRIHQHALSGQFIVHRLASGRREIHRDLKSAIAGIGSVRDLPLVSRATLDEGRRYRGRLRLALDIEALPAPMRPLAWLTWGRRLDSHWYRWEFGA